MVAVCVGETVMNVNNIPTKNMGATTYRSLQSDMHTPWNAPKGGGPVILWVALKEPVVRSSDIGVVVIGNVSLEVALFFISI